MNICKTSARFKDRFGRYIRGGLARKHEPPRRKDLYFYLQPSVQPESDISAAMG